MLRRPHGRERIALAGVLTAARSCSCSPSPSSSAVRSAAGAHSSRRRPRSSSSRGRRPSTPLAFAGVAALIALVVGGLAAVALARRPPGAVDGLVLLPLGASAVMLGFGFLIAFDQPPVDFRSSWWLVPVAQSLVAAPFVVRIVAPAAARRRPALREVAATLGASPARAWREIDLPLVSRAFGVAAGFAFAIALGEFGATVFVARAEQPTLPVAIFRFLGRPGAENQGVAAALAVVLAAITVCAALAAERFAEGRGQAL